MSSLDAADAAAEVAALEAAALEAVVLEAAALDAAALDAAALDAAALEAVVLDEEAEALDGTAPLAEAEALLEEPPPQAARPSIATRAALAASAMTLVLVFFICKSFRLYSGSQSFPMSEFYVILTVLSPTFFELVEIS